MKRRSGTAPPYRRDELGRLALWFVLVGLLIALAYTSGRPPKQFLYQWSTVVGGLVQDGIVLVLVLAIARPHFDWLALRRPRAIGRALGLVLTAVVAVYVFEGVYNVLVHPGNEQGYTPSHWEPAHAAAYVANGIVICTWVPFVEELTYRGLGYSLLSRFGRAPAILLVGLFFGLSHGLLLLLPILVLFGCILAWIRSETDSVVPGMVLHGAFNLIALVAAVAIHG